jgi:Rne/Rng family ribonuclease
MSKEMVISSNPHETRVAIMEEGLLCEYYVERQKEFALVGSIYKGRVTRVLPGMQSAFVEIGLDSDAFLYVTDFLEETEELDHLVTTVVDKVEKMEEQGGQVFAADSAAPAFEPLDVEPASHAPYESAGVSGSGEDFAGTHAGTPDSGSGTGASLAGVPSTVPTGATPPYRPSAPNRPRFENRGKDNRDSGRRGGRGRGGRFNRQGRGGERDARPGRDLPASKYAPSHGSSTPPLYASPHTPSYGAEDQTAESAPTEGYVPIVLPGESLAKYRDKPAATSAALTADHSPAATPSFTSAAAPTTEPVIDQITEPVHEDVAAPPAAVPFQARSEYRPSFGGGLEPLPGETLSKAKRPKPPAEAAAESMPAPFLVEIGNLPQEGGPEKALHAYENTLNEHVAPVKGPEEHEEPEEEGRQAHFLHAAVEVNEEHSAASLSEDEAATIAEHVAEAQVEEQAREAQRRDFASSDEAAEAAEVSLSEPSLSGGSLEEEVEESVADALDETETPSESEESAAEETEGERTEEPETLMASPGGEGHLEALEGEHLSGEGSAPVSEGNELPTQPLNARVRNDFRARMQNPRRGGRDRGGRDNRGRRPQQGPRPSGGHHAGHAQGHHRPQARRPQLIADMLKQGQEIIVQIAKEPLGKKGARITSHVALPGRYLVYMPTLDHTGVSRKIASAEERSRLRHLVNDAKGSAGGGFIVRTAAASAPPEDVRTDVEFLTRTWSEIKSRSEQRKAPSLLHRDLNLVERILRDYMSNDYSAIWVDSEEEFTKVVDFMSRFQPGLVNRVKLYTKETPVFEEFGIQQEIDKGLRPKVWLKSGGYIVINHTEALVAIDVNTGKFVGKGSNRLEDTIVRTNLEAVKEIVRQMRLRDLGGIIIIDFIDMEERRNREKVMAALEDALRADRAPSKMLRFNEFGLIAITRKRTKQALERTLCQPCPYCTGSGMVKSIPTLCYEIQTEARKMAPEISSGSITLRVHPEISKALKTREASLIDELEHWTKKSIIIQADPTLHWEQYDIY